METKSTNDQEIQSERNRVNDILAFGKRFNLENEAQSAISDGASVDQFRQTILDKPQGHLLQDDLTAEERPSCAGRMSRIGG